jgi:hypothetical protein
VTLRVHAVAPPEDDLVVVVVDGATGAPVASALVFVDDASVGVTGPDGVFGVSPFAGGAVGARAQGRGLVVLDAAPGTLFVVLGAPRLLPPAPAVDRGNHRFAQILENHPIISGEKARYYNRLELILQVVHNLVDSVDNCGKIRPALKGCFSFTEDNSHRPSGRGSYSGSDHRGQGG